MTGGAKKRPGAVRKARKGPTKGTGGHGRKALEGRGPTPKAEDRPYHPAAKRKASRATPTAQNQQGQRGQDDRRGQDRRPRPARREHGATPGGETILGRNPVFEALEAGVPAKTLFVASGIASDERVRQSLTLAAGRGIPVLEVPRPELERMAGGQPGHQGILLAVPPYRYAHPKDLWDEAAKSGRPALLVALDGVTDPHNLGAVLRSAAAFGAHGVIVPARRSAGMTASAWKTSAGAAARVPVALATNLTRTLGEYQEHGAFVAGLDGHGQVPLPGLALADRPLVLVVGSEGKGLSRLVAQTCDVVAAIPITAATESLNASVAAGIALYEIARLRGTA